MFRKFGRIAGMASFVALSSIVIADDVLACNCISYGQYINTERRNTEQIINHFTTEINAMQLAIIEGMRLSTGQLTGNLREQSAATHNLADLQDDREVVRRIEDARLQAIRESASGSSVCNVVTGARDGAGLGQAAALLRAKLNEEMTEWDLGEGNTPSSAGRDIAMTVRLNNFCKKFATREAVRSGICKESDLGGNKNLANAHINVTESVFFQENGLSATLSEDRMEAARTFVIEALNPRPQGPMAVNEANTPEGRHLAAKRMTNAARLSVAIDAANDIISRRAALNNIKVVDENGGNNPKVTGLKTWAEETAAHVLGYSKGGNNFPNGVSRHDWMDLRAKSWFLNPNWAINLSSRSADQAIKDIAMIQAFAVYQNWEQYQLLERMNMNLATQLAILAETTRNVDAISGTQ